MGNDKMDDTLMMMVYADSTGKNVTISPRLCYGHNEPTFTKDVKIQVQPGTGIANGNMTVNAICSNCRSWKGGKIDPASIEAKFIFATGPNGNINSNSGSANIKRHASYGTFTMDLTKAVGAAQIPVNMFSDTAGTVQTQDKTDHDFSAPLHAVAMIFVFVGLMPAGVLILRVLKSPRWHGYNQTASAALALIGAFLGIYAGTMYNRVCGASILSISLLTNSIVKELELCTSDLRHLHYSRHDRAVRHWIHAPPHLQTNSSSYKAGTIPRLARPHRNPRWNRQRLPRFPSCSELKVQLGTSRHHSANGHNLRPYLVLEMAKRLQEDAARACV